MDQQQFMTQPQDDDENVVISVQTDDSDRPVEYLPGLTFDPAEYLKLVQEKKYDEVTQALVNLLQRIGTLELYQLTVLEQDAINVISKLIMMTLAQEDYAIPQQHAETLVQMCVVLSNLIAMSDFKNTDLVLKLVLTQKNNFAKVLMLYSHRNTVEFDLEQFFERNPYLASLWWATVIIGAKNSNSEIIYRNLRKFMMFKGLKKHFTAVNNQGVENQNLYLANFCVTYVDPDLDRDVKKIVNDQVKKVYVKRVCNNTPDYNKVLVLTRSFHTKHAVHKALSPFLYTLKGHYHLTLLHLYRDEEFIDRGLFDEVRFLAKEDELIDRTELNRLVQNNDYGVVYYPDISMSNTSTVLSNLRIAPIQIVGYGHPVSTFGSEMDYFMGGRDAEPAKNPERYYSERLVLIPGTAATPAVPQYQRQYPPKFEDRVVVSCSWGIIKFYYPNLLNLKKVIERANKHVVFRFTGLISDGFGFLPFYKELRDLLGPQHVEVSGQLDYDQYMGLTEQSHFGVDSFHFGGNNRIVDTLLCGLPIIAYEGNRAYNRFGPDILRHLNLKELIVTNDDEYIDLMVKLINDESYRKELTAKVEAIDMHTAMRSTGKEKYFKKAIDYLVANNDKLKAGRSRDPIIIEED
ncbi:MAG: hypothetical protein J0L97_00960 [Alphaproteobacteria bacterium]|nr:hypothetical protein [Alphaproteobacteria bacterium]